MRFDLHLHSTASDGAWRPEQVVEGAIAGGLEVIALTDHDTTAGVDGAAQAAGGKALHVIPGTELSSTIDGREIHILGYFIDPSAPALQRHHARAMRLRHDRLEQMIARLREGGVEVGMETVIKEAGPDPTMLTRPHLARALVAQGYVTSVPEAFDRYLGNHCRAFVPTALQRPTEAVEVVRRSGGVPVWAHPPLDLLDGLLQEMVDAGLRGLEVMRPGTSQRTEAQLRAAAREAGLVVSGGSDWHDPERNEPLGAFFVTEREVQSLIEEGGFWK